MREVGVLIWVVLLFVGVLGSIVSSVRRQAQRAGSEVAARPLPRQSASPPRSMPAATLARQSPEPGELPQWLQQALQAPAPPPRAPVQKPAAPKPAPPKPPPPQPAVVEHPQAKRLRLFGHRHDLVRAVVAAEVLGKPRGLADEYPFR